MTKAAPLPGNRLQKNLRPVTSGDTPNTQEITPMRENSATYTSVSDINGTLDIAFRKRTMDDLDALMARVNPADLTIQELLGVTALLHAAAQRREPPETEQSAPVLALVASAGVSE